jgi:hypothetical protein
VNGSRGSSGGSWALFEALRSWALFEALRPSEGPRVREHNSKCMEAKGEGPPGSRRETGHPYIPEHDTHWQHTQVGRAALPRVHCPPPLRRTGYSYRVNGMGG